MKTIKSTFLLFGFLIFSCGDDDGGNTAGGTFTFDGQTYTAVDGFIEDYGAVDPFEGGGTATHFNYVMGISDADFEKYLDEGDLYFGGDDGVSIVIYLNLYSDGVTSFQEGTFNFIDLDGASAADISGKSFFTRGELELDDDGLAPNGDLDGAEYEITGGTITLTGSETNYTIDFDLVITEWETGTPVGNAVGSYSGEFQYQNNS
ncbi:hypothetical protein [Ekhidna sp.]|uniref:hypothetical protein n=1 Tax=Ekhidna sp. TaxID=2608089 RepID=UPI003C7E38D3